MEIKTIRADEVLEKVRAGEQLAIIDVREKDEIASGHIPGIIHIPLFQLPQQLDQLDRNTSYVIVCQSGARSAQATLFLRHHGFDAVNMIGGMDAWRGEVISG